jgi:hypothetical protein
MGRRFRNTPRRKVSYKAWLLTGPDAAALPCGLSDVSEGGARLKIDGASAIPEEIRLLLSEKSVGRPCHVVWRSETEVGLRFDRPATAENARRKR